MIYEQVAIDYRKIYDTDSPVILGMYSLGILEVPLVALNKEGAIGVEEIPGKVILDGRKLAEIRLSILYNIDRDHSYRKKLCSMFRNLTKKSEYDIVVLEKKVLSGLNPSPESVWLMYKSLTILFALDFIGKYSFPFDKLIRILNQICGEEKAKQILSNLSVPTISPHQIKLQQEIGQLVKNFELSKKNLAIDHDRLLRDFIECYGYLESFDIVPSQLEDIHFLKKIILSKVADKSVDTIDWQKTHLNALRNRHAATNTAIDKYREKWGERGLVEFCSLISVHRCIVNYEEAKRYLQQRAVRSIRILANRFSIPLKKCSIDNVIECLISNSVMFDKEKFHRHCVDNIKNNNDSTKVKKIIDRESFIILGEIVKTEAGPKAKNIDRLIKNNIPAPKGIIFDIQTVIESEIYSNFLEFDYLAEGIMSFISSPLLAVRSSFFNEDNVTKSFAGNASSFIGLKRKKDIVCAIKKTINSLSNFHDQTQLNSIISEPCFGSVIIQEVIDARASGVLSDVNFKGIDSILIEAVPGLNIGVTSGEIVDIDRIIMSLDGDVIDSSLARHREVKFCCVTANRNWKAGDQKVITFNGKRKYIDVFGVYEGGGIAQGIFKNPPKDGCLSQNDYNQIFTIVKKIRKIFNFPLDVEWAIDNHGQFYILQVRPLTKPLIISELISAHKYNIGLGVSPGVATGAPKVMKGATDLFKGKNKVLVAKRLLAHQLPSLKNISGIILESGGYLSHTSIVAREMNIPCVVGVNNAVEIFENKSMVTIDGSTGQINYE